ncbi:uncharacterized protein KGF55_003410 [Candida pseudojiufengensis]|uniref:uncharacterized protein n=1 Tax=Candida pseudojiufengensis TaxID=497109 RepID=UPI002224AF25|nr:uncharacterized protein KGF55_003410 [Candida pseudojiufengensis]KAI5962334.1 hypothetical protein KGF55_003410 [Candida pseudojiufengensis]
MTSDAIFKSVKDLPFARGQPPISKDLSTVINFEIKNKKVTLFNVQDPSKVPKNLIITLQNEFNYVVEEGQTYPYDEVKSFDSFVEYWFNYFASILIEGDYKSLNDSQLQNLSIDQWEDKFLGTFYVKPNYIGRCSHVCNAGFIVNHNKRGLGLGKILGTRYLEIAPKLGYVYSVFNLVFETNVASLKIWDSLGFERIGYVKNVAVLKGYDKLIGAHMFGKDLQ